MTFFSLHGYPPPVMQRFLGTHEELLTSSKEYQEIVASQEEDTHAN